MSDTDGEPAPMATGTAPPVSSPGLDTGSPIANTTPAADAPSASSEAVQPGGTAEAKDTVLEIVEEPEMPAPLANRSPWLWFALFTVMLLMFVGADVYQYAMVQTPDFGDDTVDTFTKAGWVINLAGILFLMISIFIIIFHRDPYSSFSMMFFLISVALLCVAMVLFTSRLDADNSTEPFPDAANTAVQFQWICCLIFYGVFTYIVYQSPVERPQLPSKLDQRKHRLLAQIRMYEVENHRIKHRLRDKLEEALQVGKRAEGEDQTPPSSAGPVVPSGNLNNASGGSASGVPPNRPASSGLPPSQPVSTPPPVESIDDADIKHLPTSSLPMNNAAPLVYSDYEEEYGDEDDAMAVRSSQQKVILVNDAQELEGFGKVKKTQVAPL